MAQTPHSIASSWLSAFASALSSGDLNSLEGLFLPDGWLRSLLVFTWDIRSLEGREKIRAFLSSTLSNAQLSSFKFTDKSELAPHAAFIGQLQATDVEFGFVFDCLRGHGQGHVRLLQNASGDYQAFTVLMMLSDLHGHEESKTLILRDDLTGVAGREMQREFTEWVYANESKPYVLVGAFPRLSIQNLILHLLCAYYYSGRCSNRLEYRGALQADGHSHSCHRADRSDRGCLAEAIPLVDPSYAEAAP